MEKPLILMIDHDARIRDLIGITLKAHEYRCITATSGEDAAFLVSSKSPEIVILDVVLPDMDGTELIRKIRGFSDVPILVVSARKADYDKVMALDAGADDYMTKPFSMEELLARIRVFERRYILHEGRQMKASSAFYNGNLKIDYGAQSVFVKEKEVHVTPIEYKILCLLADHAGMVLSHAFMTKKIWGHSLKSDVMTLRTFVSTLRKKLGAGDGAQIQTVSGAGYKLAVDDKN